MRLTLRTLLAWLDDTLSPAEVREIGKQVAESPFAKDLVERLHRVTRQRRLTVPSRNGPDAVDPNVVASYLDNELPPDQVTEFEKLCLTSDVHLAEVASVHQVLSLIGQKAKVPVEARHRMYHLVKGRESVAPKAPRASHALEPEPISEPIQPWVTPAPPRLPWLERFVPALGVLALIVLLCWSAWQSLKPPSEPTPRGQGPMALNQSAPGVPKNPDAANPRAPAVAKAEDKKRPENGKVAEAEAHKTNATEAATKPEATAPEEAASKSAQPTLAAPSEKEGTRRAALPPGVIGLTEKPTGVLLRYNRDSRQWDQLTAETPLKDQDKVLSLHPFRSSIDLGTAKIELVGESEVWILTPLAGEAARLGLSQGRVVLHGTQPAAPFAVQFAKKTLEITPSANTAIGLERLNRREPGANLPSEPILRVYSSEGEVNLEAGDAKETLKGPGMITFDPRADWSDRDDKAAPSWVSDPKLSPFDAQIGEQFQRYFRDRPVLSNLTEALDDDQRDVRRLAISSLRAMGEVSLVVSTLNSKEDPVKRRAAIAVLRAYLAQDADAARELLTMLQSEFGDEQGAIAMKLLVGYTVKEAREEATYEQLVKLLSAADPSYGLRELALDDLQSLTGRDDLGYDPDRPEGKGLRAWKDLQRNHELRPAGAAKDEKPAPAPTPKKTEK